MIPSIVTSTAVVGGLMCLELYKLIQNKPFTHHKHAYFNLAVPVFAFAQPIKAFEHTVKKFLSLFARSVPNFIGSFKYSFELVNAVV